MLSDNMYCLPTVHCAVFTPLQSLGRDDVLIARVRIFPRDLQQSFESSSVPATTSTSDMSIYCSSARYCCSSPMTIASALRFGSGSSCWHSCVSVRDTTSNNTDNSNIGKRNRCPKAGTALKAHIPLIFAANPSRLLKYSRVHQLQARLASYGTQACT